MLADVVIQNADVHTLAEPKPDSTPDGRAVAIVDGVISRVGELDSLAPSIGPRTDFIDLDGRPLLPGFIDAHTHLENTGQYLVHADLSEPSSRQGVIEALEERADSTDGWVLGFGYDRNDWEDDRQLTRTDLDDVSNTQPVAAVHWDTHTAVVNSLALEQLDDLPANFVKTDDGEPTGVLIEDAVGELEQEIDPGFDGTRKLLTAAQDHAVSLGITSVHEMLRQSMAPRVYRSLEQNNDLKLRVRINYWSDHLDAVLETGLHPNHGSSLVEVGGIKTYTDGAPAGRTAKLMEPYADSDGRGEWVVEPNSFRDIIQTADDHEYQMVVHAIGDEAIEKTIDAIAETENLDEARHRIEHCQLATDDQIERMSELNIVVSIQPNVLRWAEEGGLFDRRLGEERSRRSKRVRSLLDSGAHVAFSSDCIPIGPLFGIHHTVNARDESQRISVGEALRAYTHGSAYAGFAEAKRGTIEPGKQADLIALEKSPWEHSDEIKDIDVDLTMVDGNIVYDDR